MAQQAAARFYGSEGQAAKRVLAPMVRAGTLPLRLMCVGLGADAVYTEEIICHKMLQCERIPEDEHGFVKYVLKKDPSKVVFQTCELERDRVVFQVGSSDATRALKVAEMLTAHGDIAGFDLNCGCPKPFSISGGMGAALLQTPEKIEDIMKTLRRNISGIPITCKIRLLDTDEKTVELMRRIEAAGAMAIGVHCRETHHRPREPALWDRLKPLVDAVSVPVIANGDLYNRRDIDKCLGQSGASCAMFARGGLGDPSVFWPLRENDAPLPLRDLLHDYLKIGYMTDNHLFNTKWTLTQMVRYAKSSQLGGVNYNKTVFLPNATYDSMLDAFGIDKTACRLDGKVTWEQLGLKYCIYNNHDRMPAKDTCLNDGKRTLSASAVDASLNVPVAKRQQTEHRNGKEN